MKKLAILLLALAFLTQARAQDDVDIDDAIVQAVNLISEGRPAEAEALLMAQDSLSASRNDALQYYLGMCLIARGDFGGAISRIGEAARLDPSNVTYKEELAGLYVHTGDSERASGLLEELAAINPRKYRNFYTLSIMADAYRLRRDYEGFFNTLGSIVHDETVTGEVKNKVLRGALGNFDVRTFENLLPRIDSLAAVFTGVEPECSEAWQLKLELSAYRKDHQSVIDAAKKIIDLNPTDSATVVSNLGIIGDSLHSMGREKEAFKIYDQALKIAPDYCPVLNNYAYFLSLKRKKLRKALDMSLTTVAKEPDNPTYLDTCGWILFQLKKPALAKPYFKHAIICGGNTHYEILDHYATVLESLGEADLATYYRNLAESKKQ